MQTIKDLATGRLGLAQTFWGYGVCCNFILGMIATSALSNQFATCFIIALIVKFILFVLVLSGITLMMRNGKITLWRVLAFAVILLQVIFGLAMAVIAWQTLFSF